MNNTTHLPARTPAPHNKQARTNVIKELTAPLSLVLYQFIFIKVKQTKKTLTKLKKEEYCGFNFEQSGATWIAWKDRDHILPKMDDTCSRFLKQENEESD